MIFFVVILRAIATCLITNSHYTGVYPTDIIANGGLVGDIIFFAVSGYCLYNVKDSFFKWYAKRLYRCYLPVVIASGIFVFLGFYSLQTQNAFWWFIYPTNYHFVASIVLLYIPFYAIVKIKSLRENIPLIMMAVFMVYLLVYLLFYDKSYYHIDTVREPFIRFLFIESMLLGALFKQKDKNFRNNFRVINVIGLVISLIAYFCSKLLFSSRIAFAHFQIINQILIFALLYFIFATFSGLDCRLERLPTFIKLIVSFLAEMTLEIYVVQYVIINVLKNIFSFPF